MVLFSLMEASGSAPESPIDVDATPSLFLIQLALFVGLTLVLKPVLFDPMLKLFEEREKRIDGAKVQARHIDEKSATALAEYEAAMAKARAAANAEREKLRAEGAKAENEILAKVRATTAATVETGKKRTQEEAARVRASLQTETSALARELASKVLGREVQG
jgi:F-type H+-transporting ATPase subunit b